MNFMCKHDFKGCMSVSNENEIILYTHQQSAKDFPRNNVYLHDILCMELFVPSAYQLHNQCI